MLGRFVQRVYDFFLDNFESHMTTFVKSDSKKIILYDPNVIGSFYCRTML
jgi:hypothetical protein